MQVMRYLRYNIGGFLARVSYYASRHHYIMSQVGNRIFACGHHQNATCYNFSTYIICRISVYDIDEGRWPKKCKGDSTSLTVKYSNLKYEMLKMYIDIFSIMYRTRIKYIYIKIMLFSKVQKLLIARNTFLV